MDANVQMQYEQVNQTAGRTRDAGQDTQDNGVTPWEAANAQYAGCAGGDDYGQMFYNGSNGSNGFSAQWAQLHSLLKSFPPALMGTAMTLTGAVQAFEAAEGESAAGFPEVNS